ACTAPRVRTSRPSHRCNGGRDRPRLSRPEAAQLYRSTAARQPFIWRANPHAGCPGIVVQGRTGFGWDEWGFAPNSRKREEPMPIFMWYPGIDGTVLRKGGRWIRLTAFQWGLPGATKSPAGAADPDVRVNPELVFTKYIDGATQQLMRA